MSKVGRNDPCPCGSGKKYKRCCLEKIFPQIGKEESIRQELVQKLLEHFKQRFDPDRYEDVRSIFWGDFDPAEALQGDALNENAEINFWEWVVHDWVDKASGKALIDLYIEYKKVLSLDERKVLTMMKDSVLSLYEVKEVFLEKGLLLKDLIRGGQYDVKEKAATRNLAKWDVLATRLLQVDGQYIMSGAGYPYPIRIKDDILGDILCTYNRHKERDPGVSMDGFLKANGERFNFYWYDLIRNPPKVKLTTTDQEPMVISRAYYEFEDRESVVEALKNTDGFEEDENGFIWVRKKSKEEATILGRAYFDRKTLILECNSRERLKKGKEIIEKHIAGALYKVDSYEDIYRHLGSLKERPSQEPLSDIPFDVRQQIYTEFMEKHCKKWLTEKIPALEGKTPKQAVRSKKGKEQVKGLLKSFENREEHNKKTGEPYYDLAWMWDELGIKREELY